MKKKVIFVLSVALVLALLSTGCLYRREELREKNDELRETIDDMAGEIEGLRDRGSELLSEAEENWKLLEQCMKEKKEESKATVEITGVTGSFDSSGLTLLESTVHDLTDDGVPDKIMLYTSAGTDEHGNVMWDDGQQFILILETMESHYVLYDERVQIGRVFYMVYEDGEAGLIAAVSTYSGLHMMKYVFDSEEEAFIMTSVYDSSDINVIHNTFPWD